MYICGHDHVMQHLSHGAMDFFVCGGGAEHRDVNERSDVVFGKGSLGFLSIAAFHDSLSFKMIDEKNASHAPSHNCKIIKPHHIGVISYQNDE